MYPSDEDPTTAFPAVSRTTDSSGPMPPKRRLGRRTTIAAIAACAVVVIAAGTAIVLSHNDAGGHQVGATAPAALTSGQPAAGAEGHGKGDPGRQAWARQYGQDRTTLPDLPDVGSATPQQQSAAADLLARTEAATAGFTDTNAATAAGFDVASTLAHAEQKNPKLAERLQQIDSGRTPSKMPLLNVTNKTNHRDGHVLDPTAPETLTYAYTGHNVWKLVGVVYSAAESYPQAPPDPGGPITQWQYHGHGAALTMPVFFAAGNDLAHAYALTMDAR